MNKSILIITHPKYNSGPDSPVQRLKRLREGQLYDVFVYSVEKEYTPRGLLTVVQEYYQQKSIYYLILIGSIEEIPSYIRTMVDEEWDTDLNKNYKTACSDISYGIYVDNTPTPLIKIIVGRITPGDNQYIEGVVTAELSDVEKIQNVTTQIDKIEYYENLYDTSSSYDNEMDLWFKNVVGIASSEGDGIGIDGLVDKIYMRKELEKLSKVGFNCHEVFQGNTAIAPSKVENIGLYHADAVGEQKKHLLDEINNGLGILLYTGHAYENKLSTTQLEVQDLVSLQKNNKLFFGNVVGCSVGSHDEDYLSLAEAFQILPKAGSIAFCASTIMQSWKEPMYMQREMIRIIQTQVTDTHKLTLGEIYRESMLTSNFVESYNEDLWFYTYFGDPATRCLMTKKYEYTVLDLIKCLKSTKKKPSVKNALSAENITTLLNMVIYL